MSKRLLAVLYSSPRSTVIYVCGLVIMVILLWPQTGDHVLIAGSVATVVLISFRIALVARAKSPSLYLPTLLIFGCVYSILMVALVIDRLRLMTSLPLPCSPWRPHAISQERRPSTPSLWKTFAWQGHVLILWRALASPLTASRFQG